MQKNKIRWSEFKYEIVTLLYLITIPTWLNLQIPMYARLGFTLNCIVTGLIAASSIFIYCTFFLYPKLYSYSFNAEWLDESPNPPFFKKLFWIMKTVIMCAGFYFYWYIDFFGMPTIHYILGCANWFIIELFFVRSMRRYRARLKGTHHDTVQ